MNAQEMVAEAKRQFSTTIPGGDQRVLHLVGLAHDLSVELEKAQERIVAQSIIASECFDEAKALRARVQELEECLWANARDVAQLLKPTGSTGSEPLTSPPDTAIPSQLVPLTPQPPERPQQEPRTADGGSSTQEKYAGGPLYSESELFPPLKRRK